MKVAFYSFTILTVLVTVGAFICLSNIGVFSNSIYTLLLAFFTDPSYSDNFSLEKYWYYLFVSFYSLMIVLMVLHEVFYNTSGKFLTQYQRAWKIVSFIHQEMIFVIITQLLFLVKPETCRYNSDIKYKEILPAPGPGFCQEKLTNPLLFSLCNSIVINNIKFLTILFYIWKNLYRDLRNNEGIDSKIRKIINFFILGITLPLTVVFSVFSIRFYYYLLYLLKQKNNDYFLTATTAFLLNIIYIYAIKKIESCFFIKKRRNEYIMRTTAIGNTTIE